MTTDRRLVLCCSAYLATLWLVGILPLVSLLIEYGSTPLCNDTSLGWFIATLYGHFFIFPVAIGGLSMAALLLPFVTAIDFSKSTPIIAGLSAFYLLTTIAACALEFSSAKALFEIPPKAIADSSQFFDGLAGACAGRPFGSYKDLLPALFSAGRSYTGWFYYPGFVAQALMQNALFVVFVAFLLVPKPDIIKHAHYLPNTIFYVLGYAIFLGSIWCVFRLYYRHDMLTLLGVTNIFLGDWGIIGLYGLVLAVFTAYFEFDLEKLAKTLSQIGQFLVFIGGVTLAQFDQGDLLFGAQASVKNILALVLLFVFVSALTFAFVVRAPDPHGAEGARHEG